MTNAKKSLKKTGASNGGKAAKKIASVVVSIAALVSVFLYIQNETRTALDTIDIVRIKKDLPAGTPLTPGDLEKYALIKREYDAENMVLYENAEAVSALIHGKLTAYYLRRDTPLYQDQLTEKRLPRDVILTTLPEGYELTTVPYEYMEAGGNILLPGDLIRMRVSYEVDSIPVSDYDYDNGNYYNWTRKIIRTDTVFDSITVTDMLNSKGNSIYNIYQEVMRLSEQERGEIMKSKEFQKGVTPECLLLALMPEDVERYNSYKISAGNGSFLITILGRNTGYDIDFDAFTTLETEVRLWLDGGTEK